MVPYVCKILHIHELVSKKDIVIPNLTNIFIAYLGSLNWRFFSLIFPSEAEGQPSGACAKCFYRDWCKKNWTGLDLTIKMDIFSIFWLPLLLHSHIGTLIFPGAYQNSFLSLRVLRNTLGSIGTPRTQIQRFSKEPLSVKWPLAPKPLKRLLFFIKDGQF